VTKLKGIYIFITYIKINYSRILETFQTCCKHLNRNMAKIKKQFFCNNCGASSPKWIGKCPSCNEWNTYVEEILTKEDKKEDRRIWRSRNGHNTSHKYTRR